MSALLTDRPQKALEEGLSSHKHSHVQVLLCKGIRAFPIAWVCKTQTPRSRGDGLLQAPAWAAATKPPCARIIFFPLWFLFWLEIKTQSVKKLNRSPTPLQGTGDAPGKVWFCRGLIWTCEDSGECKSPEAYRGLFKTCDLLSRVAVTPRQHHAVIYSNVQSTEKKSSGFFLYWMLEAGQTLGFAYHGG